MHQHHKESIDIMVDLFKDREEVIAIIFGGSVAKGTERSDSDIDAMIIVTQEEYDKRNEKGTLCETIFGKCTYEHGYFDIKYMTKEYIQAAALIGSEPARNAFVCAKVLFSKDPEIEKIVNSISIFQIDEIEDKQLSFYSALMLNYMYFWKDCRPEGYMKIHVIAEIIYMAYRMVLEENQVLFPSNRRLEETVEMQTNKPLDIIKLGRAFAEGGTDKECEAFVTAFLEWTSYKPPEDFNKIITRYTQDYETWWINPRPLINEW